MVNIYVCTIGKRLEVYEQFKARLGSRIHAEESSLNACEVILAFCMITSRVGTDVEAALKEIPEGKPVVLVLFHSTFDSEFVVPDSKRFVNRPDVFLVDVLFHDTQEGLLRGLQNDEALKRAADYLIDQFGAQNLPPFPLAPRTGSWSRLWIIMVIALIVLVIVIVVVVVVVATRISGPTLPPSTTNNTDNNLQKNY